MPWSEAKNLDGLSRQPIDPYVHWANSSDWSGYASVNQFKRPELDDSWITFLAELSESAFVDPVKNLQQLHDQPIPAVLAAARSASGTFKIYIPFVYRDAVPGSFPSAPSRFFTGRIQKRHLGQLRYIAAIARWELAQPVDRPDDGEKEPDAAQRSPADDAELRVVRSCIRKHRPSDGDSKRDLLMGVIDSGCAFLQPAFRDGNVSSRIVQFWDQGVALDPHRSYWSPASKFGYGSVLWDKDINRLLKLHASSAAGRPRDELRTYKALAHMVRHGRARLPVRRAMHGTHVMDVLAGQRNPWDREGTADHAARAPLAFVQLPRKTLADGSGGSLGAHLLDGVRQLMTLLKPDGKLVISISQGSHAGPHDGSSMIERALDELLELRKNNFAIVVGAGNARNSDCHAQVEIAAGQTIELALRIPPRDTTDSFAEIWYPPEAADGSAHDLGMQLETPDGEVGPWVLADHVSTLSSASASAAQRPTVAALIHAKRVANGQDSMALIALTPSFIDTLDVAEKGRQAPPGVWKLRIKNQGHKPCLVHAWSERDQPIRPPWRDHPRWLARPASPAGEPVRVNPDQAGTLSSLATAEHVLVAGALVVATRKPAAYSSLGPPRGGPRTQRALPTPNVLAAADTSRQLPGVRAAAVQGGDTVRMSGTSVAAPTLARQLFNKLAGSLQPIGRQDWQAVMDDLVQATGPNGHFLATPQKEEG